MLPEQLQAFTQAVQLAQAGQKSQAYTELKNLSRATGARDINLLLWIAFTSPDLEEAETAISMAEAKDPANSSVMSARNWLMQEKQKRLQQVEISVPPPDFNVQIPVPTKPQQFQSVPNYNQQSQYQAAPSQYGQNTVFQLTNNNSNSFQGSKWRELYLIPLLGGLLTIAGIFLPCISVTFKGYSASTNGLGGRQGDSYLLNSISDNSDLSTNFTGLNNPGLLIVLGVLITSLACVGLASLISHYRHYLNSSIIFLSIVTGIFLAIDIPNTSSKASYISGYLYWDTKNGNSAQLAIGPWVTVIGVVISFVASIFIEINYLKAKKNNP